MENLDPRDDEQYASSGTLREKHLIVIAVAAVIVAAIVLYWVQRREPSQPPAPEQVTEVPEGSRAVTLYFASRNDESLVTETRMVGIGEAYVDQIEQVLRELLTGPHEGGVSTIAEGTQLLDVFYDTDGGVLYLDFTSEIVAGHPGGSSAEYFTIASIMRTVSQNFPEVQAVQFLVEGLQVGTIAGHIDAYEPFAVSDWR